MKIRILSAFLAALMLFAVAAIPGGTSSPVSVSAPALEIGGDIVTVTFPVTIGDLPSGGLTSCRFNTFIEGAVFVAAEPNKALGGFIGVGPLNGSDKNGVDFFWLNDRAPITADTAVVTYTVELPASAGGGDVLPIVITPSGDRNDFLDSRGIGVGATGTSGSVTILCDHDPLVYEWVIPASCESPGRNAHWRCGICGKRFADESCSVVLRESDIPVPAYGHTWQQWVVTEEPTCSVPGKRTRVCLNDPVHTETVSIPTTGHIMTHMEAIEPTAQANGRIAHWRCDFCGRCFEDAAASRELDERSITVFFARPGDANGDGEVNAKDIMTIMRVMLGQRPAQYNGAMADANDDGSVNARDIMAIMRMMLG